MLEIEEHLYEVEKQFNPLFFEITLLNSWVEEASPDVKDQCSNLVKSLSEQYKAVESEVQALREAGNATLEADFTAVQNDLQELLQNFAAVGRWVIIQTENQVFSFC